MTLDVRHFFQLSLITKRAESSLDHTNQADLAKVAAQSIVASIVVTSYQQKK